MDADEPVPGALEENMEAGWLCDSCTQVIAVVFCSCQGRETLLCEDCYISHNKKNLAQIHMASPLAVYGKERPEGYFERLQARFINIPIAKQELRKCLQTIDTCIADLNIEAEKVVEAVREFCAKTVSELQELKATLENDIKEGSEEVDATIHDDDPDLDNELARQIRSFTDDFNILKHFTYNIDSSQVLSEIQSLCIYSLSTPVENEYLIPCISEYSLSLYDAQASETSSYYELSYEFSSGMQLAFVERDALLVVGSTPASNKAFLIKLPNATVTETRKMHTNRRFPGLIVVGDFAYVFGGNYAYCEKYEISTYTWTMLPSMKKEKTGFTPCLHQDEIYLFYSIDNFEAFDIDSETFRMISVKGPLASNNSLSVIVGEEMLIVSCSSELGRWQIGSNSITVAKTDHLSDANTPLSQCVPVLVDSEVFYASWSSGNVVSFNLETRKFVKK